MIWSKTEWNSLYNIHLGISMSTLLQFWSIIVTSPWWSGTTDPGWANNAGKSGFPIVDTVLNPAAIGVCLLPIAVPYLTGAVDKAGILTVATVIRSAFLNWLCVHSDWNTNSFGIDRYVIPKLLMPSMPKIRGVLSCITDLPFHWIGIKYCPTGMRLLPVAPFAPHPFPIFLGLFGIGIKSLANKTT